MDFAYLNELHRSALTAWVDELFARDLNVYFDTSLADDQDWGSEQVD